MSKMWKNGLNNHLPLTLDRDAPCGLWVCKNRAHSVSWPEIVKKRTWQTRALLLASQVFVSVFVFLVYVVLCLIVFGCQYQYN